MKPSDFLRNRVATQQSAQAAQAAAIVENAERLRRINAQLETARATNVPASPKRIAPRRVDPPAAPPAAPAATEQIDPFIAAIARRFS
jgi:hypothetical protein